MLHQQPLLVTLHQQPLLVRLKSIVTCQTDVLVRASQSHVSLLVLHQQPLIVTWHIQQNVQKSATAAEGVTVTFQGCLLWFCF